MTNFLQNIDFLEDFTARILVLNVDLVDTFDCYIFASQFVDAKCDFAKSTFAKQLDTLIEVECRVRDLVVFRHVCFDVFDQLFSVAGNIIVQDDLRTARMGSSCWTVCGRGSCTGVCFL